MHFVGRLRVSPPNKILGVRLRVWGFGALGFSWNPISQATARTAGFRV